MVSGWDPPAESARQPHNGWGERQPRQEPTQWGNLWSSNKKVTTWGGRTETWSNTETPNRKEEEEDEDESPAMPQEPMSEAEWYAAHEEHVIQLSLNDKQYKIDEEADPNKKRRLEEDKDNWLAGVRRKQQKEKDMKIFRQRLLSEDEQKREEKEANKRKAALAYLDRLADERHEGRKKLKAMQDTQEQTTATRRMNERIEQMAKNVESLTGTVQMLAATVSEYHGPFQDMVQNIVTLTDFVEKFVDKEKVKSEKVKSEDSNSDGSISD